MIRFCAIQLHAIAYALEMADTRIRLGLIFGESLDGMDRDSVAPSAKKTRRQHARQVTTGTGEKLADKD